MLVELSIANFAIIEALRLQFRSGFIVLTGETGTGKSIIIDAVMMLLGGRGSAEVIRTGEESASIEGVFELGPEEAASLGPLLEEHGLLDDGESELILRREITRSKRNICRVNGRTVTLNTLQEIGRHLVDIHGQGEHLSLIQVRRHIDFLDRYGGLLPQRQALAEQVNQLRHVQSELRALRHDARELARRIDLLSFQVQEIEAAELRPGEEDELKRERNLLANAEKLIQRAASAYTLLAEGGERQRSITDLLGSVAEDMEALAKMDDSLAAENQLVESLLDQLDELARAMRKYRDQVEYDPERLQAVEDRIELIHSLQRKYGDSIEEVLAFAAEARQELEGISHSEERAEMLRAEEQELRAQVAELGQALSQARREVAGRLRSHIEQQLADLSMERAQFLIDMQWAESPEGVEIDGKRYDFDTTGLDKVEFLIAPNPGEEPKPLAKTASGGETSRLMLAMKTALSDIDPVPTLIFDEIDSGIGGRTGRVVGHKLWTLAKAHQVFCVTHLAQIASFGDEHYRVVKEISGGRTISVAKPLSREERVEELAIMLGGAATEANRHSADELISRVAEMNGTG